MYGAVLEASVRACPTVCDFFLADNLPKLKAGGLKVIKGPMIAMITLKIEDRENMWKT